MLKDYKIDSCVRLDELTVLVRTVNTEILKNKNEI